MSGHWSWQSGGVRRRGTAVLVAVVLAGCGGGGSSDELDPARADPSGRAVLGDDLSANSSRWVEIDEPDASVRLDQGDLVLETTRVDEPVLAIPRRAGDDLFDTETAIELGPQSGKGEVGVACRVVEDALYSFTIDDAGAVAIALWSDGTRTVLGTARHEGDDPATRLAGRCIGGVEGGDVGLLLIIDGVVVVSAVDETGLGSGASAVVARSATPDEFTARATRFEVRELVGGTTRREPTQVAFGPLPPEGVADGFDGEEGPFGELPAEVTGDFAAEYDGGTYRMRADGFIQRSAPVEPLPDHAVASVTIVKVSQGPGWSGLKWALDEDRYYEVLLDEDRAEIGVVDGDRDDRVELGAATDIEGLNPRGDPNRITSEIERSGGQVKITLVVNDEPVLEVTDEDRFGPLHFSQLFVRTTTDSTEPVEARFDDYTLRAA